MRVVDRMSHHSQNLGHVKSDTSRQGTQKMDLKRGGEDEQSRTKEM